MTTLASDGDLAFGLASTSTYKSQVVRFDPSLTLVEHSSVGVLVSSRKVAREGELEDGPTCNEPSSD